MACFCTAYRAPWAGSAASSTPLKPVSSVTFWRSMQGVWARQLWVGDPVLDGRVLEVHRRLQNPACTVAHLDSRRGGPGGLARETSAWLWWWHHHLKLGLLGSLLPALPAASDQQRCQDQTCRERPIVSAPLECLMSVPSRPQRDAVPRCQPLPRATGSEAQPDVQ